MLIHITFKANATQVQIDCEQLGWHRVVQNFMAYDAAKNVIYEVGANETELDQKNADGLRQKGVQLSFAHPLAAATFNSELAQSMLGYYAFKALWDTRPDDASRFAWRYTYAIDLWIDGFERLPLDQRQKFEYAVKTSGLPARIRQIQVNGQSSLTSDFLNDQRRLRLQSNLSEWLWLLLFLGGVFGALLAARPLFGLFTQTPNTTIEPLSLLLKIAFVILSLAALLVGVSLIATFAYALLLRPWLQTDILRATFLKQNHLLPKRVVNWLSDTLFGTEPYTP